MLGTLKKFSIQYCTVDILPILPVLVFRRPVVLLTFFTSKEILKTFPQLVYASMLGTLKAFLIQNCSVAFLLFLKDLGFRTSIAFLTLSIFQAFPILAYTVFIYGELLVERPVATVHNPSAVQDHVLISKLVNLPSLRVHILHQCDLSSLDSKSFSHSSPSLCFDFQTDQQLTNLGTFPTQIQFEQFGQQLIISSVASICSIARTREGFCPT